MSPRMGQAETSTQMLRNSGHTFLLGLAGTAAVFSLAVAAWALITAQQAATNAVELRGQCVMMSTFDLMPPVKEARERLRALEVMTATLKMFHVKDFQRLETLR